MKVKVSEAEKQVLNHLVAICEFSGCEGWDGTLDGVDCVSDMGGKAFAPSTDWEQGGPIIEQEKISVMFSFDLGVWVSAIGELWVPEEGGVHGSTPLIAAMRCYVASKLGDEVEVAEVEIAPIV